MQQPIMSCEEAGDKPPRYKEREHLDPSFPRKRESIFIAPQGPNSMWGRVPCVVVPDQV